MDGIPLPKKQLEISMVGIGILANSPYKLGH
jgi:hypothetical protein